MGMFTCAYVINKSTRKSIQPVKKGDENGDEKEDKKGISFQLFWIQNRKSDLDRNKSWILFSDEPHYVIVTLHPRKEEGKEFVKNTFVCIGVGLGISGFIMQLFGIRMMRWSAAIPRGE
jgi:hypothetical protein